MHDLAALVRPKAIRFNARPGAPSQTIVVIFDVLPSAEDCVAYCANYYAATFGSVTGPTKIALCAVNSRGHYSMQFLQVVRSGGRFSFLRGRDCLNSMAAAGELLRGDAGVPTVRLVNVETGLSAEVSASTIYVVPARRVRTSEVIEVVRHAGGRTSIHSHLNNPYLILPAHEWGASDDVMSGATTTLDASFVERIAPITDGWRAKDCLAIDLPKVAVVAATNDGLAARTVYYGRWHPGLPLTGAVSIAAAAFATFPLLLRAKTDRVDICAGAGHSVGVRIEVDGDYFHSFTLTTVEPRD